MDAAPTTLTSSALEDAPPPPEEGEWLDATDHPGRMRELVGMWGSYEDRPRASLYSVYTEKDWDWPYSHSLTVQSEEQNFECGFWSPNMRTSYCSMIDSDGEHLERRVLPLRVESRRVGDKIEMRVTLSNNKPVVVVRHATP